VVKKNGSQGTYRVNWPNLAFLAVIELATLGVIWNALRRGRVPTAHLLAKQFWAEREKQPRLFWMFVALYIISAAIAVPVMLLDIFELGL
jgi:hypothetical protein